MLSFASTCRASSPPDGIPMSRRGLPDIGQAEFGCTDEPPPQVRRGRERLEGKLTARRRSTNCHKCKPTKQPICEINQDSSRAGATWQRRGAEIRRRIDRWSLPNIVWTHLICWLRSERGKSSRVFFRDHIQRWYFARRFDASLS
jgi:hypothetical protein